MSVSSHKEVRQPPNKEKERSFIFPHKTLCVPELSARGKGHYILLRPHSGHRKDIPKVSGWKGMSPTGSRVCTFALRTVALL